MITKAKRKKMEDLIYSVFGALDPTGANVKKYKSLFEPMTDEQFDKFFKKLFASEDSYLILDVVEYERPVTLDGIEKAAAILKVPLFEKVFLPYMSGDPDHPIVTKVSCPVGYVHLKPMQQITTKKNSTTTTIDMRSQLTGQVTGKDKTVRESDAENFALVSLGAKEAIREFMGPRADDLTMKQEMYSNIARKGYTSLNELTNKVENKITLNTVDVYFLGMGIKSDLVTDGLVLRSSLKN